MASAHSIQNGDGNEDRSSELLHVAAYDNSGEPKILPPIASDFSGASDEIGEPDILPRIGYAYQVDIPPPIKDSKNISYSRNCIDLENSEYHNMLIGLPIKVTWIGPMKFDKLDSRSSPINISELSHGVKYETCSEDRSTNEFLHDLQKPLGESKENMHKSRGEGYCLVPGLDGECWSGGEKASFLLGLYIFEKNFVEVRRFVETKNMGSLLSFYYGRFYGSRYYIRWTECRKRKTKKHVCGQRIFTGVRQQELLSRLIPNVSEECQDALLEVSKSFKDEKMSLVDYVSSLKAMVGMNALVKAIGIGTGKQDLTGVALEPSKSNRIVPKRIEIPIGKACSSLKTAEIINFLSGDYRLSKARANDLFWEAVWPRLLARGWHSEQPMNQGYVADFKHCLVFLIPGVKKFSRSKLVKGDQYFDSITDVLSKVAKEPEIIELDIEESESKKSEEERKWTSEGKLEQDEGDNQPTSDKHFYLEPRIRNRKKFTVVDTSLCGGIVRELRSLPSEISNLPTSKDHTVDIDEDTSLEITEEPCRRMLKGIKIASKELEVPIAKRRRRLPAHRHEEASDSVICSRTAPGLEEGMPSSCADAHESSCRVEACQDKLSSTVSSKGSSCNSTEFTRALIDLNIPQVIPDFENDVTTECCERRDNQTSNPDDHCLPVQHQPTAYPRRHSTRNRPPTVKALEALASGYLTVNRRRKCKDVSSQEYPVSRPMRRARVVVHPDESSIDTPVASQVQETEKGPSDCNISSHSV